MVMQGSKWKTKILCIMPIGLSHLVGIVTWFIWRGSLHYSVQTGSHVPVLWLSSAPSHIWAVHSDDITATIHFWHQFVCPRTAAWQGSNPMIPAWKANTLNITPILLIQLYLGSYTKHHYNMIRHVNILEWIHRGRQICRKWVRGKLKWFSSLPLLCLLLFILRSLLSLECPCTTVRAQTRRLCLLSVSSFPWFINLSFIYLCVSCMCSVCLCTSYLLYPVGNCIPLGAFSTIIW